MAPVCVYVRLYDPPVTSGLVQQLSTSCPQLVIPAPPAAQLAGMAQLPDEHVPEPLQLFPSALVHAVVLLLGVQISQPPLEVAPDAK